MVVRSIPASSDAAAETHTWVDQLLSPDLPELAAPAARVTELLVALAARTCEPGDLIEVAVEPGPLSVVIEVAGISHSLITEGGEWAELSRLADDVDVEHCNGRRVAKVTVLAGDES
jgi:hypothetical protein